VIGWTTHGLIGSRDVEFDRDNPFLNAQVTDEDPVAGKLGGQWFWLTVLIEHC
jgi:hypothetical protein